LEDFVLDDQGLVVRCANDVAPVSVSAATVKLQARFDLSVCRTCPHVQRCPVQAAKHDGRFARFRSTPKRAAYQKRRLYEKSDAFRDIYRWRAGSEGILSPKAV
jgi:ribosomal protein RSM22 (predicted rRNA methylase)